MDAVIIGGGLAGLSSAYLLSKNGYKVMVLEKENYLGGLAGSYEITWDGKKYSIPFTYHHILDGDKATEQIIDELGLNHKIVKNRVKTAFLHKGKITGITNPIEFLRFDMPFLDKIKLIKFIINCILKEDWSDVEGKNAKDWLLETAGQNVYETIYKKLIYKKYGISPKRISATWLGMRMHIEPKTFLKKFRYLDGGIEQLVLGLKKNITENDGVIKINSAVIKIKKKNEIFKIKYGKRVINTSTVINTAPIPVFLKIFSGLSKSFEKQLNKINYSGVICGCFGLNKNFTKYYWINFLDDMPIGAILNHTVLYPWAAPKNKSVMYVVTYGVTSKNFWKNSDKKIIEIYKKHLDELFSGFSTSVDWVKIYRNLYAEPLYERNYIKYQPDVSTPIKGLYFAGIFRIYPRMRNMASAIESGFEAAEKIMEGS